MDTPGFGDGVDNEYWWVIAARTFQGSRAFIEKSPELEGPLALIVLLYSFQEISSYLERQYDDILAEESRIKRNPRFRDNRVHALIYFISPTGHA